VCDVAVTLILVLFSPLGKLANRAIMFYIPFFFKLSKVISGSAGPIFTIFFTKWKVFA